MLVLTRRNGETIHIGNGVTITIFSPDNKPVRVGIEADKSVVIVRGELRKEAA